MKYQKILVIGSGPYCVGSSVEFDWCGVQVLRTLRALGIETVFLNSNPETVSTDFDECNRLYFDEITTERVLDICKHEQPDGVIFSTGGQVAQNLCVELEQAGVPLLGTSVESIVACEDRAEFSQLCDDLGLSQPEWASFSDLAEAKAFATKVEYPVLVRPSFVLSGAAMAVANSPKQLEDFLQKAQVSTQHAVVISKFEQNAKEIEFDGVAQNGEIVCSAISEHIENAGVHSGDATIVLPPQNLYQETIRRTHRLAARIAKKLNINGPFNIQFLARDNFLKIIECNLRASRSFPFVSKVLHQNFIEIVTKILVEVPVERQIVDPLHLNSVGVKTAQFSFSRLKGSDPNLGVEMSSTGEVACFGKTVEEAFLKSLISVEFRLPPPKSTVLVTIGKIEDKADFLPLAKSFRELGFNLVGTQGTAEFLQAAGIECLSVGKIHETKTPNIMDLIEGKKISLVINTANKFSHEEISDGYLIRRQAIDRNIPLLINIQLTKMLLRSLKSLQENPELLQPLSYKQEMARD